MSERILGPQADPDLADIILKVKNDVAYSLFCVQIGTIQVYDPVKNTATITINFKRQIPDGSVIEYPLLVDCPVFILSGGDSSFTMPIKTGDQCIILFNDRNIDNWYYSGAVDVPDTPRAHNIADGMALVGIRNLKTAKLTPQGSAGIDAGTKKIYMKNLTANFKTLIDALIDSLVALQVQGPGVYPLTAASIATLNALKVQFALLFDEGLT